MKPRHRRVALAAAAAATSLATLGPSPADAGLIVDLRLTAGTGSVIITSDGKGFLGSPGETITVGIFARVSGTNGVNDETLHNLYGSVVSTGDLMLNIGAHGVVSPFNGTAFQDGSIQDIDGDGDLDLGSTGSTGVGKFFARSNAPTPLNATADPNTGEVLVGLFTATISGGDPYSGPVPSINFVPRTDATGGNLAPAALWFEDGSTVARNPTASPYTVGAPVVFNRIPEPGSLGLMALSSAGLLARRKLVRRSPHAFQRSHSNIADSSPRT